MNEILQTTKHGWLPPPSGLHKKNGRDTNAMKTHIGTAYSQKVKGFNPIPNSTGAGVRREFLPTSTANQFFIKLLRATCDIFSEGEKRGVCCAVREKCEYAEDWLTVKGRISNRLARPGKSGGRQRRQSSHSRVAFVLVRAKPLSLEMRW